MRHRPFPARQRRKSPEQLISLMQRDRQSSSRKRRNRKVNPSTLLRRRRPTNLAVLAPTGLAAVNIGGQTIHSFFRFPPRLLQEQDIEIHKKRVGMYSAIETIIIDEISMVRADLLDAIDVSLRLHRSSNEPFGGVQMVLIGDICQLPPVVTRDLKSTSAISITTPYFFAYRSAAGRLPSSQRCSGRKIPSTLIF